nr:HIT family protein [uncultured Flavobacterium sp.]
MGECRFCQIIHGDRKNEEIIYEDNEFIIITDKYRKTSLGSICLLIPKNHLKNILELTGEHSKRLVPILNLVSKAMQSAYKNKGIRIWTAVNKEAGQSVFHCHIHIVPCDSLKDRMIANFPGIYDLKRRVLKFGNNELRANENFKLAEKLRTKIKLLQ